MEYFTTAAGITVHLLDTGNPHKDEGEEKTVVLLHGYLETMNIWNELVELLKVRYRVITLDMPGHGLTDSAPEKEDGTVINSMEFCADMVKALIEKCGARHICLGGHSMGGYATLAFCRKYPDIIDKAVLFNSNPYRDDPAKSEDRRREIEIIRSGKLEMLAELSIPKMFKSENLRLFDDKILETIELCDMHNPDGIVASVLGMQQREDTTEVMDNPPVPIMMFEGDSDRFMSIEAIRKMMADFPKVKHILLENTGHNSFIEVLPAVYQHMCNFIG
ncbi:MAG: alpha/beta hydrolase [Bacteroidales bacterium]|nr:alpha/beta hydrolase [Bacteroidales bacterium]